MKPLLRFLYELHYLIVATWRRMGILFLKEPMFRSQVEQTGATMVFYDMPILRGNLRIRLGEGVMFGGGNLRVIGAGGDVAGELILGDHAGIGANSRITAQQRVELEEHVMVSFDCSISDADMADERPAPVPRPVKIGRYAWIGNGVRIYQGGPGRTGWQELYANDFTWLPNSLKVNRL